ncbi:MAG: AmmeMemoRadiSam system protein A [Oligoflexia bacterium]|nr:AmmeMemoRadiSam system protein A [Oligoflexia bacterium]
MQASFENQILQIAALGTWCIVTGEPMQKPLEPINDPRWEEKSGVFVTLKNGLSVRGSVGMLESSTSLQETLFDAGQSAATHDHRFTPVSQDEIENLSIEVTLINNSQKIKTPNELLIGSHGLVVSKGDKRSVMLPQVAIEKGWSAVEFLEATCEKAGLKHDDWRDPNTLVEVFDCQSFQSTSVVEIIKEFISSPSFKLH